jgi:hypothetical protein
MTKAHRAGRPDGRVSTADQDAKEWMECPGAVNCRGAYPLGVCDVSGAFGGLSAGGRDHGEEAEPGDEVSGAHRILRYGRAKRTDRLPR